MRLDFTPAARAAVARDLAEGQRLHIAFAGGCGALGFRIAATRRSADDEIRVEVDGLRVVLDRQAFAELDGATVDWNEDEGYSVEHPGWGVSC